MGCGASKDDAPLFESPNLCTSACGCLGFRLRVQATVPPRVGAAPAAAPLRPRPPLSASSPQYLYPPPLPPPTPAPVADHFVEVLFFPDPALPCREHYRSPGGCSRGDRCKYAHSTTSLSRLLAMLDAVRCTIDVCVFTITSDEIAQHILAAAARGVRVRVITDDGQAKTTGSEIETFVAAGIEVRHDKSYTFMHHKFAVLDRRLLLNGSFNWTRAATLGNQENLVASGDPRLVVAFEARFEMLWEKFKDNRM